MAIRDTLLPEFDREMAITRRTLERIPDDKLDWKPHDKSMSLGGLSGHLANLPGWAVEILWNDSFDLASPVDQQRDVSSRHAILEAFDANVSAVRAVLAEVSDENLAKPWSLLKAGAPIFTLPRAVVFRTMVMNHSIHHRAQLGVYLRLNDVPVPATYGPSADESGF